MDTVDKRIDRIWEKVYQENPDLMNDWIQCFSSSSYREGKDKSKEEIKMTLSRNEYQIDPRRNFLWRLMSKEPQKYGYADPSGERKRRGDLAMLFTQVIIENSFWNNFVATTLALRAPEPDDYGPLYCSETTTQLHNAARFENVEGVKKLLAAGERMQINPSGYTPLHFAAMAINPKPEIAKLLIGSVNGKRLLNEQTNDRCGRNTALHIAAANVKVTEEFIQHFKDADPLLRNSKNDTPFHVAAKSSNPQAIIYMLNTFEPTNKEWDVDEVDCKCQIEDQNIGEDMNENELLNICARLVNADTKDNDQKCQYTNSRLDIDEADQPEDTLIKICARAGNAEAVELLIKHGADIAHGVLHEIVIESVRNPEKINDLLRVYQSVVDNAVTWRNLEEDSKFLTVEGSEDYAERFRKTMIWLLTTPNADYGGEDALQCALTHGASRMFWSIVNTKSVFRMDGKEASRFANNENESENVSITNWTVFDVTNFTRESMLKPNPPDSDSSRHRRPKSQQTSGKPATKMPSGEEGIALWSRSAQDGHRQQKQSEQDEQNNSGNKQKHGRNFDVIRIPQKPYIDCLLSEFHLWKNSNVLSTQPFNELTKPYIKFVQHFYLVLGLLQLVFMITFSVYWMPNACSLAAMFNVSTTRCSSNSTEDGVLTSFNQRRSWIALLWLIWPLFLIAENAFITYHYIIQSYAAQTGKYLKRVLNSKDQNLSFLGKLMTSFLRNPALRTFCVIMLVWLYVYFRSGSRELYVEVTSMVFLFGWITNLSFFGAVSKNVSISKSVVDRIIIKDISSFMLFFGFNVVGFSFAMHTIRMSVCMASQSISLHDTFFAVLSSAFGIGDFFDATTTDGTCVASASTETLFEFVYLGYVCTTMIVLLNILIAMINSRYEKAKRKAENIWRFETLSTMIALKSVDCLRCSKCCGRENKLLSPAGLSFSKEFNRYYLRLLLPVDQRLIGS